MKQNTNDLIAATLFLVVGWLLYTPRMGKFFASKQLIGRRDLSDDEAITMSSLARGGASVIAVSIVLDKVLESTVKVPAVIFIGLIVFVALYRLSLAMLRREQGRIRSLTDDHSS